MDDGRPTGLAKALRDRLTIAGQPDGAISVILDLIDMDGIARQAQLRLQIVDGLQALPAWDFDVPQLAAAFQTVDTAAVPVYREQQREQL